MLQTLLSLRKSQQMKYRAKTYFLRDDNYGNYKNYGNRYGLLEQQETAEQPRTEYARRLNTLQRNSRGILQRAVGASPEINETWYRRRFMQNECILDFGEQVFTTIAAPVIANHKDDLEEARELVVSEIIVNTREIYHEKIRRIEQIVVQWFKRPHYDLLNKIKEFVNEERYQRYAKIIREYMPKDN